MREVCSLALLAFVVAVAMTPLPCAAQTSAPSFDCSRATMAAEKMVCADPSLTALDSKLAGLYGATQKNSAQAADQKTQQRKWLAERNRCAKSPDAKSCVEASYQRRIAAIQIQTGSLDAPLTAKFDCGAATASQPFTAAFYNRTDPPSAVLTYGNDRVVVLTQMSGSGSRYGAPGIDYWEHQGEATVVWRGKKFVCKVLH